MRTNVPSTHQWLVVLPSVIVLGACDRADRDTAAIDTKADTIAARAESGAKRLDTALGTLTREYTPGELIGFVNAANDAEMEIGELARQKATDPQVRAFAQRIVSEHRALKTEAEAVARQLSVTPTMPEADENLPEDHQAGMRDLSAKAKGREFDEAFLEHEIRMHRKVVDEVKDELSRKPAAALRTYLEKAQAGLEAHLKTAEELEKKFGT